jgi:hypothetical protein
MFVRLLDVLSLSLPFSSIPFRLYVYLSANFNLFDRSESISVCLCLHILSIAQGCMSVFLFTPCDFVIYVMMARLHSILSLLDQILGGNKKAAFILFLPSLVLSTLSKKPFVLHILSFVVSSIFCLRWQVK